MKTLWIRSSASRRVYPRVLVTVLFLVSLISGATRAISAEKRPLMRFPDVHKDTVVFIYGEDIWKVSTEGGLAARLTIHDGQERFPKFSPDGNLIAFTGEYDGNADVYVMSTHGGNITRVTFHPGYDEVVGWHPLKNKILFRSDRHSFSRFDHLFLISPTGTDRIPMWIKDKIYFSSDRDGVLNIYSYDTTDEKIEQITHHTDYDVRRPSQGIRKIVYELGGMLWLLDVDSKESKPIPVEIRTDTPEVRPHFRKVDGFIQGIDCSPSGKRALIVARGEVFTVPGKDGPTRNLTNNPGARDKDAVWSLDGKKVAYLSDQSGEYEIYVVDSMGRTEAVRLTQHENGYRHTLRCFYLD